MIVHYNLQNREKKITKKYQTYPLTHNTHFNRREFRRKSHATLKSLEKYRKRREEETASVYVALTKNQDSTWRNSYFRRVSLQSMLLIYETISIYQFLIIIFFFFSLIFLFFFFSMYVLYAQTCNHIHTFVLHN